MAVNHSVTNPKALAQAKRTERRRRTRRIRQGVAAGTITLFVAFFSTIYAQMASGHDPALSASRKTPAVTTTTTSTSSASGAAASRDDDSWSDDDTSSDDSSSDGTASQSTGTTASSPAPVTTQQS